MLNMLEGFDLKANGYGSAQNVHLVAESMRRAFADRAQHVGDPDFNTDDSGRPAHLEGLRHPGPQDHQPEQGVGVVADQLHVADRIGRDHASVGGRRQAQRRVDDLHPRVRLRLAHRRSRRRVPAQQRDGRLQLGARTDRRARQHRHRAEPRGARQADAVEHVADHPRQGRQAVHGHRLARRPHHHQHGAADHPQRRRLRDERPGGRRRRPRSTTSGCPTGSATSASASPPTPSRS